MNPSIQRFIDEFEEGPVRICVKVAAVNGELSSNSTSGTMSQFLVEKQDAAEFVEMVWLWQRMHLCKPDNPYGNFMSPIGPLN